MAISRAPRYSSEKPEINKRLALYVGVCVLLNVVQLHMEM